MSTSVGAHAIQERSPAVTPSLSHDLLKSQDIGQPIVRQKTQIGVDLMSLSVLEGRSERPLTADDDSIIISTDIIESATSFEKLADGQAKGTLSWHPTSLCGLNMTL